MCESVQGQNSLDKLSDASETAGLIGCSQVRQMESPAMMRRQKQQVHTAERVSWRRAGGGAGGLCCPEAFHAPDAAQREE